MNHIEDVISEESPLGFVVLVVLWILLLTAVYIGFKSVTSGFILALPLSALVCFFILWLFKGLTVMNPGEAVVLTFFGDYVKTIVTPGYFYFNPLYVKLKVSTKQQNNITEILKINDASGNPIEVGATITYYITDVSKSIFGVDDIVNFIKNQSEASLRAVVSKYHYDSDDHESATLRGNSDKVSKEIKETLTHDLKTAGISIVSAKISHLAYAPEIASSMLKRQQAEAVISARKKIVEGAVSMVEMALREIAEKKIATFDELEKARLVTNLMTVLVSEEKTQPTLSLNSK